MRGFLPVQNMKSGGYLNAEDRKTEERAMYNKKDTYTYEEVRPMIEAALEDRARYLAFSIR